MLQCMYSNVPVPWVQVYLTRIVGLCHGCLDTLFLSCWKNSAIPPLSEHCDIVDKDTEAEQIYVSSGLLFLGLIIVLLFISTIINVNILCVLYNCFLAVWSWHWWGLGIGLNRQLLQQLRIHHQRPEGIESKWKWAVGRGSGCQNNNNHGTAALLSSAGVQPHEQEHTQHHHRWGQFTSNEVN